MKRTLPAGAVLGILMLVANSAAQTESRPTTKPRPASRPILAHGASRPTGVQGSTQALALARRVHEFAGGYGALDRVHNLVFTYAGGRRILWSLDEDKVRIETLAPPPPKGTIGTYWEVLVYDIAADKSLLQAPPKPHPSAPNISGKSMWLDDCYWLLLPLKVLDDGVVLAIDPLEPGDAAGVQRLRITFAGVGIHPENRYVLHVETRTGKVLRSDFQRTERSPIQSASWERWTRIGPLQLALLRVPVSAAKRAERDVEFSAVAVDVAVPEDIRTRTTRLLKALE